MPDPFRIIPTRFLGHGFAIAEALGCSVSPVAHELFSSVATGYILLHAIHRGLSAGGGPLLFTTFFDTLIFEGLASAIVPSFITFHVRAITAIWLKQRFLRSLDSLAPSRAPSPPLCLSTSDSEDNPKYSKRKRSSLDPSPKSSDEPLCAHLQTFFPNLFAAVALERKQTACLGSHSKSPSSPNKQPERESHSSASPTQDSGSELETNQPTFQDITGKSSPEPYPLVALCFNRLYQKCALEHSANPKFSASLTPRGSRSEPELGSASDQDLSNWASPEPYPLIASCFDNLRAISSLGNVRSPRATFSSENILSRRQSSDTRLRSSSSQQEQESESAIDLPPPASLRKGCLYTFVTQIYSARESSQRHKSESQLPLCPLAFCLREESISPDPSPPVHPGSPVEDFSPPCKLCPAFFSLDGSPPLSPPASSSQTPLLIPPNDHDTITSSRPPSASVSKAVCAEVKRPAAIQTWGPVVAGLVTLAYTWQHIDRMVDELMNQTIRTVY
ncbi:hypothetical protein ElyMa_003334100 [Elysia marginata]|uniref:Uncharacterized protein n=1 Tax=Elysia marginata TaxID=1093978 RepID=A0AAV4JFW6_9GAST|nr:hypothetical protein ElyMa_003334100 [Elysia marginata]